MSKDLLKRKKRRFLRSGGINPPADLIVIHENAEEPVSETADEPSAIISAMYGEDALALGPVVEVPQDISADVNNADDGFDHDLDLVFAEIFAPRTDDPEEEAVSDFFRRGRRAVAVLFSALMVLAVAYNTGVTDFIESEIDSYRPVIQTPVAEPVSNTPEMTSGQTEDVLPAEGQDNGEGETGKTSTDDANKDKDKSTDKDKNEQQNGIKITIFLTCDGETVAHDMTGSDITVQTLLSKAGVRLENEDVCEPSLDTVLSDRDSVTVTRIKHVEYSETVKIPANVSKKYTPLLREGRQKELRDSYGEDGERKLTYRDEFINGERTSHELLSDVVVKEPIDYMVLEGASVSMSPLNGARFTDIRISGSAPESYERLITGYCTAYHFNRGVWGASGMYLYQGFVAVDPSVIPYGSLLYITNSDGSFVYGWAIAADYCQAAAEGRVVCDLFFDTYEEPYLFGKHTMNIYVVKQLYRDELQEYVARQGYFDNRVAGRPYVPPAPEPEPEPEPVPEETPAAPEQTDTSTSGGDSGGAG